MNTVSARNALAYLYKYVEAGEKGYAVVASNVRNRALKILYRAYAQQRLTFKEEIFAEIQPTRAASETDSANPNPGGTVYPDNLILCQVVFLF